MYIYSSNCIPLFAISRAYQDVVLHLQHFTAIRGQILVHIHMSLPKLVGLHQHTPFGNLGRRKQMPDALWALHARTHAVLWIEKCSYSINAPFEILLQQHSSLYCNYTYCISLYSDPWGIYIVLAKARGTEGKQSFNDSAVLGSMI